MTWTVILEDENGNAIETLKNEFILTDEEFINKEKFKLLKYLNSYGDMTFNENMISDLISDFKVLKNEVPNKNELFDNVIKLAIECKNGTLTYLKLYGD